MAMPAAKPTPYEIERHDPLAAALGRASEIAPCATEARSYVVKLHMLIHAFRALSFGNLIAKRDFRGPLRHRRPKGANLDRRVSH
jgi:hypothetical protein